MEKSQNQQNRKQIEKKQLYLWEEKPPSQYNGKDLHQNDQDKQGEDAVY
jgi:hypothetical protein